MNKKIDKLDVIAIALLILTLVLGYYLKSL